MPKQKKLIVDISHHVSGDRIGWVQLTDHDTGDRVSLTLTESELRDIQFRLNCPGEPVVVEY